VTTGWVVNAAPEVAVVLGCVLKDEWVGTAPTVYLTTSDPEAPV